MHIKRDVRPRFTVAQAEAILEMLCHASAIDDKEKPLVVYERAAEAIGDALAIQRMQGR